MLLVLYTKKMYIYILEITFWHFQNKSRILLRYITTFIQTSFTNYKCVACSSSMYGFWLPLWYLQTLLTIKGPGWLNELGIGLPNNSYKHITNTAWVRARLCKLQKRGHSTRSRKLTSCLPIVSGSLRVLRLLPPIKLVAMI